MAVSFTDLDCVMRAYDPDAGVDIEEWNRDPESEREGQLRFWVDKLAGDLTDDEHQSLRKDRGGCACQHPNASPPCSACSEPLSVHEALEIANDRLMQRERDMRHLFGMPEPEPKPAGWGAW